VHCNKWAETVFVIGLLSILLRTVNVHRQTGISIESLPGRVDTNAASAMQDRRLDFFDPAADQTLPLETSISFQWIA